MNNITKVSEITATEVAEYIRLIEPTSDDIYYIQTIIGVAKDYILKYTGIADLETLDNYQDMVIVVFVLCQDMYDNRAMYVDNTNLNKVVDTILGMHQVNLL
jgi:hypothetical protein